MSLVRYLTHRLVLLSLLVSLGIAGLLARNLWVVHENALASAELASRNLSHTLAVWPAMGAGRGGPRYFAGAQCLAAP